MTVQNRVNHLAAQSVRKYTKLYNADPYRLLFPEQNRVRSNLDPLVAQMLWAGR